MVWLEWNDKRLKAAGIGFVPGRKDDLEAIDISGPHRDAALRSGCHSYLIRGAVYLCDAAGAEGRCHLEHQLHRHPVLALGCLLAFALFHKRIHAFRDSVNDTATNSLIALMNTAVVTGFGGVVQGSHGFELVKEFALSLDMNPLISACVATAIVAAACGSCSGGLSVFPGGPWSPVCAAVSGAGNRSADPTAPSPGRAPAWTPTPLRRLWDGQHLHRPDPKETYPYFFVTNIGLTALGCVLTVALYMLFGLVVTRRRGWRKPITL